MADSSTPLCTVSADELATLLLQPHQKKIVLDSRSFLDFNANHVVNAVNVVCSKLLKRRLQNDKLLVTEFLAQNFHVEIDSEFDIYVYDQTSSSASGLTSDSCLSVLLGKLSGIAKSISLLCGGFMEFETLYPELCINKTRPPISVGDSPFPLHPQHHSISQPCLPVANVGPTKILPFLFLGSQVDALCVETMKQNGISYVLNVSPLGQQPEFIQDGHFLRIPVNDNYSDKLLPFFKDAFQFLDKVREANGRALVHCLAGISRSPTVVIAYVMYALSMTLDEAYRYIKDKRPSISPNFNFLGQLLEYEKQQKSEKNTSDIKPLSYLSCSATPSAFPHPSPSASSSSECVMLTSPTQTMARLSFGSLSPLKEQPSPPVGGEDSLTRVPGVPLLIPTKSSNEDENREPRFDSQHSGSSHPVEPIRDGLDKRNPVDEMKRTLTRPKTISFMPPQPSIHSAECSANTGTGPRKIPEERKFSEFDRIIRPLMPLTAEVLLRDRIFPGSTNDPMASIRSSFGNRIFETGNCRNFCDDDDDQLEPVWKKRKSRSLEDILGVTYEIPGTGKRKYPTNICTNRVGCAFGILASPGVCGIARPPLDFH